MLPPTNWATWEMVKVTDVVANRPNVVNAQRSTFNAHGLLPIGTSSTRMRSKMALGPDKVGPR